MEISTIELDALGSLMGYPEMSKLLGREPWPQRRPEWLAEPDKSGLRVIEFSVSEKKGYGEERRVQCNRASFAFLWLCDRLGASLFIDYANNKHDRPYLNVGGKADGSAGITAGRILAGHEEEEDTLYLDGNRLNLTHANLGQRRNPRTWRGAAEIYAEALSRGRPEHFDAAKALWDKARENLEAERGAALRS